MYPCFYRIQASSSPHHYRGGVIRGIDLPSMNARLSFSFISFFYNKPEYNYKQQSIWDSATKFKNSKRTLLAKVEMTVITMPITPTAATTKLRTPWLIRPLINLPLRRDCLRDSIQK